MRRRSWCWQGGAGGLQAAAHAGRELRGAQLGDDARHEHTQATGQPTAHTLASRRRYLVSCANRACCVPCTHHSPICAIRIAWKLPSARECHARICWHTHSSGRYWLAPHRSDVGELQLLSSVANKHEAQGCWVEVQKVTERMMAKYFEGVFCGGCNCLEQLAGKALT
uniref:Uncharacterized protein n=1 Tax=Prymnesium polylepis TaxID=72548 RepID=A0A6T8C1J6_9EUKA|mmetsp:Transcript_41059/g.102105  ORF Transcript_41059/g.102105 Transcript_41059/m.102105 type:complete len:168 (+) Transcript_41059:84-587(+)